MNDHGHPLAFGSFLTPAAADPDRTVALAVLSEQIGLDLVTFQDHPYQPAFLDTWTLLSHVAARTERVSLAANVLNLPLRPPAVLARSAASLDLLSGGRLELGLGAGAFWDAIAAMGGQRLTPGQAVTGLAEAIEIIRQIWDVDTRGGARVAGQVHEVQGAKRGPAPAHDIGIWLGAYRPRMLRLVGRSADGWLPSLAMLPASGLTDGNARIDEAALDAGRPPSAIRRLLNISGRFGDIGDEPLQGPVERWVDELTDLALGEGISTFILASDLPDDLRRFAGEVAPAVRELVDAERSTAPAELSVRSTTAPDPVDAQVRDHMSIFDEPTTPGGTGFAVVPTPDDGRRRSARRMWDEGARPTGPARDPGRDYTPYELAAGQQLVDIHDHLRAELTQIQDLVGQVVAGTLDVGAARSAVNTMTMRQNNWTLGTYCESYCRVVTLHHTIEDQSMLPHLRRADPRLAPVVDRLQREHLVIHDVLEGVDRALVALVSGPDGTGGVEALQASVDLLSDTLLSHLSYEERELVEPLARLGMH